jgi:hypothetical protein
MAVLPRLWHECEGDERARVLVTTVHALDGEIRARQAHALRNARLFEGRALASLDACAYDQAASAESYRTTEIDSLDANILRGLVQTAVAQIACKQQPRAMFCVSGGDWKTRRRAQKLEKFVAAIKAARHGMYLDAHSVNVQVFRDCCIFDLGVKYWFAANGRIRVDRVPPWEIVFDSAEAQHGDPLNVFRVYQTSRHFLAEQFPDFADHILSTASNEPFGLSSNSQQVEVTEGWRRAIGKTPGAHCVAVGGVDVTGGEAWERETFPFEFMRFERRLVGMSGTPLLDTMRGIADKFETAFQRWDDAERYCSNSIIAVEKGSVTPEQLSDNRFGVVVEYAMGRPRPDVIPAQSIGPASIQWLQTLQAMAFQLSGVGQQSATGERPQGVDSAIAMRTVQAIATERFAQQWQMYEQVCAIGDARQILACAKDLEAQGEALEISTAEGDLLAWRDVDVDIPDEAIQVYSVSGLVNTPADRIALGERLFAVGIISKTAYLRIIQAKDIDSEIEGSGRQTALLDRWIQRWLDCDDPASDEYAKAQQLPICMPWLDLESAMVQVGRAFMPAEYDGAPDAVLESFAVFMRAADLEMQKRAAVLAQMQTPPQ